MSLIERLKSSTSLRLVVIVKLTALAAVWALNDEGFYIGDRSLSATDNNAAQDDKSEHTDKSSDESDAPHPGATEGKQGPKTRKSFLSNLLELPKLETDGMKKDELGKYLEVAERKRQQIEERLEILKRRDEQLKGLEKSIDEKLRVLDEERRFFSQTIQQEKDLKGERLDKLITMYAKMEPKKAAPVFEKLDKDLVVELFKKLPQKQITLILETMNPDKSVELSEYYGRVRSAREYDLLKEMNQSLRKEFDDCKGLPKDAE